MNILHMKYAVEVAKAGSINKASEKLLIAQPNLSRSIKELETDLGITIFDRSAKGIVLTMEGENFIGYAQKILAQISEVENMYRARMQKSVRFSIAVPRSSYISETLVDFTKMLSEEPAEIYYQEANALQVIDSVLSSEYRLGIIRYQEKYERYFKSLLKEKGLTQELVMEFRYLVTVSRESPIASIPELHMSDMHSMIEITHPDTFVPTMTMAEVRKSELMDNIKRRIFVGERASQLDILSENLDTFMWGSPLPGKVLDRYGLVQLDCHENRREYKDMLIHRKGYRLTELDKTFLTLLSESIQRIKEK